MFFATSRNIYIASFVSIMDDTNKGIDGLESMLVGPDSTAVTTLDGETARSVNQAAFNVDDSWSMPRYSKYEHVLCAFMAFAHNRDFARYSKDTVFTHVQL